MIILSSLKNSENVFELDWRTFVDVRYRANKMVADAIHNAYTINPYPKFTGNSTELEKSDFTAKPPTSPARQLNKNDTPKNCPLFSETWAVSRKSAHIGKATPKPSVKNTKQMK